MRAVARTTALVACGIWCAFAQGIWPPLCESIAADAPRGSLVVERVPVLANVGAQLAHARVLDERASAATGRERLRLRLGVVEALRLVREAHAGSGNVGARAALEAGAHLGAIGLEAEAWSETNAAVGLARDDELVRRARLERAHAARRIKDWERALEDYRWCAARGSGENRVAALLRAGEALAELGRPDEARLVWTDALQEPIASVSTVGVYDRLARAALDRGDPEAAAGWLAACDVALGDALVSLTPTGAGLRRALVGMRARFELQCLANERAVANMSARPDPYEAADESGSEYD